jgi:hypothetical protein
VPIKHYPLNVGSPVATWQPFDYAMPGL